MPNPHIPLALIGLAAFAFLATVALAAGSLAKNRDKSSLLKARQDIADNWGWGDWERLQQHPISLPAAKWITRTAAAAAFGFTCWHAANAVLQD